MNREQEETFDNILIFTRSTFYAIIQIDIADHKEMKY